MIKTKASIITKSKSGRNEYGSRITEDTLVSNITGYCEVTQTTHELANGVTEIQESVKFIATELLILPKECYLVVDNISYSITNHKVLYKKGTLIEAVHHG